MNVQESTITVAVVGICGLRHIKTCLTALENQVDAPPFDTVVVYDPLIEGVETIPTEFPDVRTVANTGQRTPMELAAKAIQASEGEFVFLTEDHCVPTPRWVRTLYDAQAPDRAAVGGTVATEDNIGPVDWSFYFVDYFRYAPPGIQGDSPSLTVCNVAYRREYLDAVSDLWQNIFHETEINEALRSRFGALWLEPDAKVNQRRQVAFKDAMFERYAFGRLFGCTRLRNAKFSQRLTYVAAMPLLPPLLLLRMGKRAMSDSTMRKPFIKALPALSALVFSWSWGEFLGYLTNSYPRSMVVASELRTQEGFTAGGTV